jgi:hypothetical protein
MKRRLITEREELRELNAALLEGAELYLKQFQRHRGKDDAPKYNEYRGRAEAGSGSR